MSFKEFDLSDYITALEDFKNNSTDDVIKHWGSIENFDMFIQKIKDDESELAKLAIQQFGSIEKYTEAMKHNLEHFSELMETQLTEEVKEIGKQSDILYGILTADLSEDVSSPKIQSIVSLDKLYINVLIDIYSGDYIKSMTDSQYGKGASDYIVKAFRYYSENNVSENNQRQQALSLKNISRQLIILAMLKNSLPHFREPQ